MRATDDRGRLSEPVPWQTGTVTSIKPETPRAKSFRLALPHWRAHVPGQYYTLRLTAPDGYRAIRSYSIASSPLDEGEIELTVDCLADGEVSPFLHDVVEVKDELEVRGPLTQYFTWTGSSPVLLIGGGSGIVPLMSICAIAGAPCHMYGRACSTRCARPTTSSTVMSSARRPR